MSRTDGESLRERRRLEHSSNRGAHRSRVIGCHEKSILLYKIGNATDGRRDETQAACGERLNDRRRRVLHAGRI